MPPRRSYTIWFSQRTGSTLLCRALAATGVAGRPDEWLLADEAGLRQRYSVGDAAPEAELVEAIWRAGSTPNGVFGIKVSFYEPRIGQTLGWLRRLPGAPQGNVPRAAIWEHAFPHGRHIVMTRRNKVRLAVSWWKAIQSHEWHRERGARPEDADLADAYSFDAISQLFAESVMREAGVAAFLSEARIAPLTIVYEDFVLDYEGTVRRVLEHVGLDASAVAIAAPAYEKLADELSERWVQRFRHERQRGWQHRGW